MKLRETTGSMVLEDWACRFTPSNIIFRDLKTGRELQEISLVAAQIKTVEQTGKNPRTGESITVSKTVCQRYLAAGNEARAYANAPDVVVFSPLRHGQIADYDAAEYMFKALFKRLRPKFQILFKPNVFIHVQEQTTEVEERALIDAGIQMGARKVFLYREPLSAVLDAAASWKLLRRGYVFHIEPRVENP